MHRGLAHFSRESKRDPGCSIEYVHVSIGKNVPVPLPGSAQSLIFGNAPLISFALRSLVILVGVCLTIDAFAADVEQTRKSLIVGEYQECIKVAAEAIHQRVFGEDWYLIKTEAEVQTGRYQDAFETISAGLNRYAWSIRMRQAGIEPAFLSGHVDQGKAWQTEISEIVRRAAWRYDGDAESLVSLGKTALLSGADARQVLELFYDRALRVTPTHRGALLASGELAISKSDFGLAAETFQEGLKVYPNDPELHFGLARSIEKVQPKLASFHLSESVRLNPRLCSALLYQAEQAIDSEQYLDATKLLDRVLKVNELHPHAWALYAVMAHLDNLPEKEKEFRDAALKPWPENPAVDYLIGRKLSQKYRFAEGAEHQRRALAFAADYLPAKMQLAQDLLRLGQEEEGWQLSEAVLIADGYDVQIFNLVQLRDQLAKYTTFEADGFRVRMETKEAAIYGEDVIDLLKRAKQTLCAKYGMTLEHPITVEIFADPNDFAVRTFGLPGAGGYLGVCFGKVITANSPATQKLNPVNWHSVLWHEFCHVVTLEKTKNRMPRWLSEGVSVYEERQASPTWGQRMSPKNRKRIIDGQLTPIRELSGSFLRPEKPEDLNFAYYQSSLLVEHLIQAYGLDALKRVFDDLAAGVHVEDAIVRHTADLDQIDMEFRDFALEMARRLAPELDWEQYDLSAVKDDDDHDRLEHWVEEHPTSVQGLTLLADQLVTRREYAKAKACLKKLIELYPEQTGLDSAHVLLAAIHRELNETADERKVLEQYVERTDDAKTAFLRLIELQTAAEDWHAASRTVRKLLEVNPLLPQAQKARSLASERLDQREDAIKALRAWLLLNPDDLADCHFRLAKLLYAKHDPEAKTHILEALEAAPRFRDAQKLLLKIVRESDTEGRKGL